MQKNLYQSRRIHKGNAAAYSAGFGFETLESRQFMSVAPLITPIGSIAMVHTATITATKTPLAVNATTGNAPIQVAAKAATSNAAGGTGVVTPPPAGNDPVAARSIWGAIKGAAKWVGKHVVIGLKNIAIKGKF